MRNGSPACVHLCLSLLLYPLVDACVCQFIPEDGVMGVATRPLTLKAAICCICAAAMAAMGFR